ncbi:MAG: bifunctional nuclease family protein [Planctomycetes bacterium]|nr:bifunctional nuclease family protein [Planctomycetota bacterium]
MDLIEVELSRVIIQQKGDQQYLNLRERQGTRTFSIVIGFNEVEEINRKLCGYETQRPLTHDLIARVIGALGHRLQRIVVNDLREGTFYAFLGLTPKDAPPDAGAELTVDCRPSDAIALAVQTHARIFVARHVFDEVCTD